jgi:hypothetical protein
MRCIEVAFPPLSFYLSKSYGKGQGEAASWRTPPHPYAEEF